MERKHHKVLTFAGCLTCLKEFYLPDLIIRHCTYTFAWPWRSRVSSLALSFLFLSNFRKFDRMISEIPSNLWSTRFLNEGFVHMTNSIRTSPVQLYLKIAFHCAGGRGATLGGLALIFFLFFFVFFPAELNGLMWTWVPLCSLRDEAGSEILNVSCLAAVNQRTLGKDWSQFQDKLELGQPVPKQSHWPWLPLRVGHWTLLQVPHP